MSRTPPSPNKLGLFRTYTILNKRLNLATPYIGSG
jgi:hypothetical protein